MGSFCRTNLTHKKEPPKRLCIKIYLLWNYPHVVSFNKFAITSVDGSQRNEYQRIDTEFVDELYKKIMLEIGGKQDKNGKITALPCSPYLYLQILYSYYGSHTQVHESLICIDEAQNVAPEELRLISSIHGGKVVFNLYGDIKQHIENSKGIDKWESFCDIADFTTCEMEENYRNARQITEYCNTRFQMKMRAINLDGSGYHELMSEKEMEEKITQLFLKPLKDGLNCIIVKTKEEAETFLFIFNVHSGFVNDMVSEDSEIVSNKWNLLRAEEAKGLEFETAIVFSGRMTENEKYIAYSRVMDELYIFDEELVLRKDERPFPGHTQVKEEPRRERPKREKRPSKE